MLRDRAYELMRSTLEEVLPSIESCARGAKSSHAKKRLIAQIEQIRAALIEAERAAPALPLSEEQSTWSRKA